MKSRREKILESVKEIREINNLSQYEMAEKIDLSQSAYARFETGKSKTDLVILEKFCNYFKMDLLDIFYYPENPPTESNNELEAQLIIKLKKEKKDQILKLVFGENNLEILNR